MRRPVLWTMLITLGLALLLALAVIVGQGRLDPRYQSNPLRDSLVLLGAGAAVLGINAWFAWVFAVASERHPKNKSFLKALQASFAGEPSVAALWEIVDGKLALSRGAKGSPLEPPKVVIPKDHAIVFEDKTGKFTHADLGPSEIRVQPTDDLSKSIVVMTRPRFKRLALQGVVMKDAMVLDRVEFSIYFHLKTDKHFYPTDNIQNPIAPDTITQAVYGVTFGEDDQSRPVITWEAAVQEASKSYLRSEMASVVLLDLYEGDGSLPQVHHVADQAKIRLNKLVDQWGVVVETLDITHIAVPTRIQKMLEERWIAERSLEIKEAEGKAEGKKIEEIESAKTKAWQKMATAIRTSFGDKPSSQLLATRYIQILQHLDHLVKMIHESPGKTVLFVPQQGDALYRDFEKRLMDMIEKEEGLGPSSPRDFVDGTRETGATIVGGDGSSEKESGSSSPDEDTGTAAAEKK